MSENKPPIVTHPFGAEPDVEWIDQPGGEERSEEWEWLLNDVRSTVGSLDYKFGSNETDEVISMASYLMVEVAAVHEAAGVIFLPTDPIVDIGGELDLARRLVEAADLAGDERAAGDTERSDIRVVFGAIAERAMTVCDLTNQATGAVAGGVEHSGQPALDSLHRLANLAAVLAEWAHVYIESAIGYHRVSGHLPDTLFGGGTLSEMHDWERVQMLRSDTA